MKKYPVATAIAACASLVSSPVLLGYDFGSSEFVTDWLDAATVETEHTALVNFTFSDVSDYTVAHGTSIMYLEYAGWILHDDNDICIAEDHDLGSVSSGNWYGRSDLEGYYQAASGNIIEEDRITTTMWLDPGENAVLIGWSDWQIFAT